MCNEIRGETLKDVHAEGVNHILIHGKEKIDQNGEGTIECTNLHFIVTKPDGSHATADKTTKELDLFFASGVVYGNVAARVAKDFDYGYGALMREGDMLDRTIALLKRHPETRRAYIPIFHPCHVGSKLELPCLIGLQFMIVEGALDLTAVFRSNDCGQASPSDDFGLTALQRYVAFKLNLSIGKYYRYVISAHLKKGDADKFDKWGKGY